MTARGMTLTGLKLAQCGPESPHFVQCYKVTVSFTSVNLIKDLSLIPNCRCKFLNNKLKVYDNNIIIDGNFLANSPNNLVRLFCSFT